MSKNNRVFPLILDKLILNEIGKPFVFGVLIFTMIFVSADLLFQAARLMIQRGISFWVVSRLFCYRIPEVIGLTLPMAALLAALLGFSKLSANSELVAIKSMGVSFRRILRPVIISSIMVSIATFLWTEFVTPITSIAANNLMQYEIYKNQSKLIKDKVFLRDEKGGKLRRTFYVEKLNIMEGTLEGIDVYEFADDGRMIRYSNAATGLWKEGEWWIDNGQIFEKDKNDELKLLLQFERQKLALSLSLEDLERTTRNPVDMSARELWLYIEKASIMDISNVAPLLVTFHYKISIPWASFVLAILGAAIGGKTRGRSGGGASFGLSVLIVFAYYLLMSLCRALGESGNMAPLLAAWLPNAIFLFVGLYFVRRAN
ncbi:MAG: LptF/LptG family permease [Synergistaceae bacterium]|nr:LptF/LptG family permease [Synergistaceae bacterium]